MEKSILIGTAADKAGNVLELYCNGSFYGKMIPKNGAGKPFFFGKCIEESGGNLWFVEYNKDGSFKSILWYNIGPAGAKPGEQAANKAKIQELITDQFKGQTDLSLAADEAAMLRALAAAREHGLLNGISELKNGQITQIWRTVMYQWPQNNVYRLYSYPKENIPVQWVLDNENTPLGRQE